MTLPPYLLLDAYFGSSNSPVALRQPWNVPGVIGLPDVIDQFRPQHIDLPFSSEWPGRKFSTLKRCHPHERSSYERAQLGQSSAAFPERGDQLSRFHGRASKLKDILFSRGA